jgi:hypothetical protein
MGTCCSTPQNTNHRPSRNNQSKQKKQLEHADPNASQQIENNEINEREKILRRGITHELESLVNNFNEDIDSYVFGQNKTLLLEACIVCPNPEIIDLIMEKKANVDCEEYQTGNTPIFLCAVDLKVDFVEKLLKYHPNLLHKNHSQQNIFDFLKFQLFDQRKSLNREMNRREKEKYQQIESMLKKAADE